MVGVKKFSAVAAFSALAVTGAVASLQHAEASHAHHVLSHRGIAEHQVLRQQNPSMVKVHKRLLPLSDGVGGILGGLGQDLERRGLVGDVLGAGGEEQGGALPPSGASSASAPASTSQAQSNNATPASSDAPASSRPAASHSPAPAPASSRPASNANTANTSRPSSAPSTHNNNNSNHNNDNSGNQNASNNQNGKNSGSAQQQQQQQQQQAASASSAPAASSSTGVNSAAAAASASASAAAASAVSAAAASQSAAGAAASAAAATLGSSASGAAAAVATTGVTRANSNESSSGSDGTTKVVVPIVVIVAAVAVIAIAWTLIRRIRNRNSEHYDPRLQPVESRYHHRSMMAPPLAAGGAAFAIGGAAAGLVRDRPRRDSYESFQAGRPMSMYTEEEGDFSGVPPPMQEIAPYAAVGSAHGGPSSRLRNYGSTRGGGGDDDFPPAHRVTDSMYVDDYAGPMPYDGAVTPFSDEHGAYDVNYYDGSSTLGYNNPAARGMDAAGTNGAGRPYSPYADLHRGDPAQGEKYEYDRASSSRRDPFGDSR